jgi:hypothetical protein
MKDIILKPVEHDYLMEIEDDTLGFLRFLNQTPRQMIEHLKVRGGALDFTDTKTLLAERDLEWDVSENPQVYFNRVKKAVKALTRAGITSDMNKHRDMALYYFKASGQNVGEHQNFHCNGIRMREQTEQAHRKAIQSQSHPRAGQGNGGTHHNLDGESHSSDGDPNQKHNRCNEGDDAAHQVQCHHSN